MPLSSRNVIDRIREDYYDLTGAEKKTADRPIQWLSLADLPDTDPKHYGLNGSPTQVKRIFPPDARAERTMLEGDALDGAWTAQLPKDRPIIVVMEGVLE